MLAEKMTIPDGVGVIALVSPDAELQQRLRAAFKGDPRCSFLAIQGAIWDVQAHLSGATGPAVLVVDMQQDGGTAIAAISALRRNGFAGGIIAISDDLDEPAVRGMLRLAVTDWLPGNAPTEEIVRACEQAFAQQELRPAGERMVAAKCLSFLPAAGGVGNTTLAIQAAFLLAEREQQYRSTCLIDLNFQSGVLADYLDLMPGFDVDAVAATPQRLDARLLEVMLARHPSGIAVLAAPRAPACERHLEEAFIANLLSLASQMFANVIIDLSSTWMGWSECVLAGSDRVFVVTEFTVPALRKAHDLVAAARPLLGEEAQLSVIVNKTHERYFGGGLRKRDAAELLGDKLAGFVSEDRVLVREAIDRGRPLSTGRASNRLSRELARIVTSASRQILQGAR